MSRFRELFNTPKPIIAMAHTPPLPGTPLYDAHAGTDGIVDHVRRDVEILVAHGVDGILFCNEGDRPYQFQVGSEAIATMARVVADVAPDDRPYGVDFLWDARAALAVAVATGAAFIRETVTGTYESDMGLWSPDAGGLLRERRRLDANHIAVFMNITPEFASRLGTRSIGEVARSVSVSSLPDAILVSGPMAGAAPDLSALREAREATPAEIPVIANTGVKSTNVTDFLAIGDGAIVGSDLKVDGHTWNAVDPSRVERFRQAAS